MKYLHLSYEILVIVAGIAIGVIISELIYILRTYL